jgi:hypothetical protein
MIKYTPQFLAKIEELIGETEYILRYEKGSFSAGYCVLKDTKIIIINKFFSLEGRINALLEIIRSLAFDDEKFTEKSKRLHQEIINYQIIKQKLVSKQTAHKEIIEKQIVEEPISQSTIRK